MSECLKCKYCGRLEPLPRGDPSRLQSGQWGMLARGLVYCSLPGEIGGYKRFRSVESKDRCKYFRKESDQSRIERRCLTVKLLRAAFNEWMLSVKKRTDKNNDRKKINNHLSSRKTRSQANRH